MNCFSTSSPAKIKRLFGIKKARKSTTNMLDFNMEYAVIIIDDELTPSNINISDLGWFMMAPPHYIIKVDFDFILKFSFRVIYYVRYAIMGRSLLLAFSNAEVSS
jgi:hypothetical protein